MKLKDWIMERGPGPGGLGLCVGLLMMGNVWLGAQAPVDDGGAEPPAHAEEAGLAPEEEVSSTEEVSPAEEAVPEGEASSPQSEEAQADDGEALDNELLVVVGAEGEPEYGQLFAENLRHWREAAGRGRVRLTVVGPGDEAPLDTVEAFLGGASKDEAVPLWIVFIGHGTYDRRVGYFNLEGPDLTSEMLETWLEGFTRPVILVNTASSSGAFLPVLSRPNRILVTATKSGTEVNFPSFGGYLAEALGESEADLNNDGENSIFELFYYAARETADFYAQEGQIQTETPLLDDNGDGVGTSLEALEALREGTASAASREPDGSFAKRWALVLSAEEQGLPPAMRQKRNVLESQIEDLRRRRETLGEETYYAELEALALRIADLYAEVEDRVETDGAEEDEEREEEESPADLETGEESEESSEPEKEEEAEEKGGSSEREELESRRP